MSLPRFTRLAATLLLTLCVAGAHAAGPDGFSVQHFQIKPGADRIFSVEGTKVAPAFSPYGGLWFHYVDDPLRFVFEIPGQPDREDRIVENMMQLTAGVGIGLFDFMELELVAPITLSSEGDTTTAFNGLGETGLSDLIVRLRAELLKRGEGGEGFGLNLGVGVGIPTGDSAQGVGDGGVTIQPKLALSVGAGPVTLSANLGVNVRTETESFSNLDFDQEFLYGAGVQWSIIPELALGAELFGRTQFGDFFSDSAQDPLEWAAGPKIFLFDSLIIDVGAGMGIISGYGAPDWRVFAGVSYADFGGVVGSPDTDGDGITDDLDQCITEAEDADSFMDDDGCPDIDNDVDGVLDVDDKCPLEPEDKDGFEDTDGCPDPDNDGDGIADAKDGCMNEPEDTDGFEDDNGCPDPDNDNDTILDVDDKCPMVPENLNGFEDTDGCPDEQPLARVEGCKIIIGDKVYFRTNKATILDRSFPLLDEVARLIKGASAYDYVMIEGHTDSRGSNRYNKKLSDRRAKSVRKYLVGQGIPSRKLKAKGWGEEKPIAPNDTPENLAKNRRVDFNVVGGECKK